MPTISAARCLRFPGHPLDPRAEGTNRLIKQGATLVTAPEEVVEVLRPILGLEERRGDFAAHSQVASSGARPPLPRSRASAGDKEMNAVLAALGPAPVAVDEIARATGLSVQNVQIAILELDLAGRIERQGV